MTTTRGQRALRRARSLVFLALLLPAACAHRLTAEQIAVLRQEGFKPKDDTFELDLSNKMLFDTDSDLLKAPTKTAIERTGGALTAVKIRNIRVEGYTDNTGTDDHNLDLSKRRAGVVAQALGAAGMKDPIAVRGLGKQSPVADNATEAGRAENRRVAVIVPADQD